MVADLPLSRERLQKLSKDRSSSKSPIERFAASPIGGGNEPSPEVIEAACREQKFMYPLPTSQSRPNSFDSGHGYRTPELDSGDGVSTSSTGSMHSSSSNSSFRSNGLNEFRRGRKFHRRSLAAMQQKPRKDICVELDCTDCETAKSFQLIPQATTMICLNCGEDLGKFSVAYGLSASFIKVGCPNAGCNHQNYQTTTKEAKDTILRLHVFASNMVPDYYSPTGSPMHVPTKNTTAPIATSHIKVNTAGSDMRRLNTDREKCGYVAVVALCKTMLVFFCSHQNPTTEHFKNHWYDRCHQRGVSLRTYSRKDQFMQHLRAFHRCALIHEELVVQWRRELENVEQSWRCGICESFSQWSERLKHIEKHWEQGLRMSDWKAERLGGRCKAR